MSKKVEVKITGDNVKGSESGQELIEWEKGKKYTVTPEFAKVLVDGNLAEYTDKKAAAEEKAVEKSPENKAVEAAPENKSAEPADDAEDDKADKKGKGKKK